MKESAKWRSGRDLERLVTILPSSRGGKSAAPLRDDERVAAEDDGDVMVPTHEGPSLEVVEPELSFELLIHPLRPPAFLDSLA
jgi:hypothetical protein